MESDVGTLQKREGLVFFKLLLAFLFLGLNLYGQTEIELMKKRVREIPGVSPNAKFYSVLFKNETERNLYLCISLSSFLDQPVLYVLIEANDQTQIELLEGAHYFTFMDLDGNPRGQRDGGELLIYTSEDLSVQINEKEYVFENTFFLDVIASNDQEIKIDNDGDVRHNSDKSDGEHFFTIFLILLGLLIFVFIALAILEKT